MACYGRFVLFPARQRRVLVTGAGGWLGGEIAGCLAARGWEVTALVHRRAEVVRNDGTPGRVVRMVAGDVSQPRFGWNDRAWSVEAGSHDLIVHCAALTQFGADPGLAGAVNVDGTAHALALAEAGGMGMVHVSTAYVNGSRQGRVLETELASPPFTNSYEWSKAEAESVVRSATVPAVIVRPGIVVGDWAEGRVRDFSPFYLLLKAFAEGRVRSMPAEPWATLDLGPVDHVAGGVVALAERFERAAGRTFHLVSGAPTPVTAFPMMLSRYDGLFAPELVPPARCAGASSRVFQRLIAPYAPYFSRNPRFDDTGFRALTGQACPEVGPGWWGRLIEFALAAGFLRAPVGRA